MFRPNIGDVVTLVDGGVGVVSSVSDSNRLGQFVVSFTDKKYFDASGTGFRVYLLSGMHVYDQLPRISRIDKPMSNITTPYDTQIAAAEKALAELKAKAIAEAEAKKTPKRRWYKDTEEFLAVCNRTMSYATVVRRKGETDISGFISPTMGRAHGFYLYNTTNSNVYDTNFELFEYSTDGKTWHDFGVLE